MAKRPRSTGRTKKQSKRRAFSALEIARRELEGDDSSSDNETGKHGAILNARKKEDADSGEDSFEDEELDSDEALGSDDDYDVLSSKFSQTIRDQKKAKKNVPKYYDSEEDDGGYTSIEEDELVSLSAAWDMDDKESKGDDDADSKLNLNDNLSDQETSASEESSSEEEEVSEEEDPFADISEDEDETNLSNVVTLLNKDKDKKQMKKLENYTVGEENEFALPTNKSGDKLDISAMLAAVDDPLVSQKASLLKGKQTALATPLPQRIQKRLERKAAYEISKDEVNKWQDAVQHLRQAEHISFPLNPETQHNESNVFIKEQPNVETEVESKVSAVLEKSDLAAPLKESTFEEIETAKMTPAEMKKRTAELRLMRELMFREERKAKRIKKIKSKAYRRIKKKEMLKNQEFIESDESDTDHDIARAKERMTLKHKTQGKWAKDMIKHGMTKDKETREEMEEMLRQGERLKEKILGRDGDEQSADEDIDTLEADGNDADSEEESSAREKVGKTGVLNMAFMRNAEAREKEANEEQLKALRDMERNGEADIFDAGENSNANKTLNQGRRVYTPGTAESREELTKLNNEIAEEIEIDQSKSLVSRLSKDQKKSNSKSKSTKKDSSSETDVNANPWLNDSDDESNVKKSSKVHVVDQDSSQLSKAAHKIRKEMVKQSKKKPSSTKDEDVLLDLEDSNTLNIVDAYGGSDDETSTNTMFKQQEVIADAFAGDDVVSKFEEEKRRVAVDEDDKEEDVTLPGWGDWAGAGAETKRKRKFIKKTKGVVEKDKRRDKSLKNVIINERVNKKNLKYQSSSVPFPFESREQYERSLRMPLGQEWTSRTSHQKMIKPRILTKGSTVIDPLKAPFK
ncbi:Utp14p [Kluyveromyces lactis]|uniref:KLLA0D10351p n=1 Tax=Kluyveromyces lactis (strain ATCC 8585 / CBS 2359 / DSM 70799 / NBRC 1267 / NRRL Y-1140 / WM37) TaxID=284590 RepID=Q6CRB7_KLULA|nr:uncharacterized protein KLLA0_D10351g [Kluyveromyces lactis]CAH00618.1 KLLA0D10351p [Kluyveromyces lactis]|eukprot:XP_453522.1 uncharacterized protein KLLA0_D10351g [Kluyveromyces lactis]